MHQYLSLKVKVFPGVTVVCAVLQILSACSITVALCNKRLHHNYALK